MILHAPRKRPDPWRVKRLAIEHGWMVPFVAFEYPFEWFAYFLSHWSFLETLEYLGSFSILIAVIFYFSESGDRLKQKHYQAWQVINTAQGKGGSGGRLDALQELNADGVPLVGVDVSGSFLQGVNLQRARLVRSDLGGVDARDGDFGHADLNAANLRGGNFRNANFEKASLQDADMSAADFCGASLANTDLTGAKLDDAELGKVDWKGAKWKNIKSLKGAHIANARNTTPEFLHWAVPRGAVTSTENSDCE